MVRAHLELAHTAWPLDTWQSRIRETAQIRGENPSCACRPRPLGFCRPPKADVRFSSPPAVRELPAEGGHEKEKKKENEISPQISPVVCVSAVVCASPRSCWRHSFFVAEGVLQVRLRRGRELSQERFCTGALVFLGAVEVPAAVTECSSGAGSNELRVDVVRDMLRRVSCYARCRSLRSSAKVCTSAYFAVHLCCCCPLARFLLSVNIDANSIPRPATFAKGGERLPSSLRFSRLGCLEIAAR